MNKEEQLYTSIGQNLEGAEQSQMFGKPCFKINGKAFISFYDNNMVFKLTEEAHSDALSLDGSQRFDPSRKNRPMKEWIQVLFHYKEYWADFAQSALDYMNEK